MTYKLLAAVLAIFWLGSVLHPANQEPIQGGRIVSAFLGDLPTLNPLATNHSDVQTFNQLVNPGLIRLNLITHQPEPSLASSWQSEDGLSWTFELRKNVQWSDGQPLTADDVLFTMKVINDPHTATPMRDGLSIDRKPIEWSKVDSDTVIARLPAPFAPFLRKLDGAAAPILPKHKWESVYQQGKWNEAMPVTMNLAEYVCAGPFLPSQYRAGQNLTLKRNARYWKKDKTGKKLPYLDEITFLISSDLNQLQLKIESDEVDTFPSIRPEDIERLKQKSGDEKALLKIGLSYDLEGLFFNQNGDTNPKTGKPFLDPVKRAWFANPNFRRAISFATDRDVLVKNVFYGMAVPASGVENPSNRLWFNPQVTKYPYNPDQAVTLLKREGFSQQKQTTGQIKLFDKTGREVRFSLHTNAGNTLRNGQCIAMKSDLAKLGITVDYSALEFNALVPKITQTYDFDAILLGVSRSDIDPATRMSFWLSSGSNHFWWPQQKSPQTLWEKRIDELMGLQLATGEYEKRKKYYDEVQAILADQLPIIYTINELVWVYAKQQIGNLKPSISRHRTLWNAEELYWKNQSVGTLESPPVVTVKK